MSNEYTKHQIKTFLQNAVKEARNPNPREKLRRMRQQKAKKVAQKYGL